MASATAPIFYGTVALNINVAILLAFLLVELIAFVHCLTQRSDAFPVVGSLTKQAWLAILGAAVLVTLICTLSRGANGTFLGFVGVTAAAIYLLDVRPALSDTTNGSGSW